MTLTSSAAGGSDNPLLRPSTAPHGTPEFTKLTPEFYEEAVKEGIHRHNEEIDAIVSNPETPGFLNTIVALDRSGVALNEATLALSNVEQAMGDTTLMNVMAAVTPLISEHSTDILLNEPLWARIKAVYDSRNSLSGLSAEDMRLIEETYPEVADVVVRTEPDVDDRHA